MGAGGFIAEKASAQKLLVCGLLKSVLYVNTTKTSRSLLMMSCKQTFQVEFKECINYC